MLPIGHDARQFEHLGHEHPHVGQPHEEQLDPRVKRTRQLLVRAFVELSREKEFSAITIQDIAERATVNRATFYAHFEDKYALQNYYVRQSFGEKIHSSMEQQCTFTQQNMRSLIVATCEYMAETHAGCRSSDLRNAPQTRSQVQGVLYILILRWIKSLPVQPVARPIAPETLASTLSWTVFGASIQWITEGSKQPTEEVARQLVDLMTGGLTQFVDLSTMMR